MSDYIIEMIGITKEFPGIKANDNITLQLKKGEIHALLGENGAGKSTLMSILFGLYNPDSGVIKKNGEIVNIKDPNDANALGIGMVHQHFKLVENFTVLQNIILGAETVSKGFLKVDDARKKVKDLSATYGLYVDTEALIEDITVGMQQRVEILKMLYRDNDILIFDEPTAVLTPQEIEELMKIMKNLASEGKSILFITHKLNEVLEISDRVTILRKGESIATVNTCETSARQLTEMMVGEKVELNIVRDLVEDKAKRLEVKKVTVLNSEGKKAVDDVSFDLYSGEVLGIAGISGCGQKELLEAIMGLVKVEEGASIIYNSTAHGVHELVGLTTKEIISYGLHLAFVPEDRLGMGLVGSMGMTDNVMLKRYRKGEGPFLHRLLPLKTAEKIRDELDVKTPDLDYPVRKLSGGNVQKVLVGREINNKPTVLMTAYATRGLDINTSYAIYNLLNEQKKKGVAVIYVGEDLDVLLALSDRIMVLCEGKVNGILDGRTCSKEEIGLLMTHMKGA